MSDIGAEPTITLSIPIGRDLRDFLSGYKRPAHYKPITDFLDGCLEKSIEPTEKDLFRLVVHPRPLQLFFAHYLSKPVRPHQSKWITVKDLIDSIKFTGFLSEETLVNGKRKQQLAFPMTREEFGQAVNAMHESQIQNVAIVLQNGIDKFYDGLAHIFEQHYGIDKKNNVVARMKIGTKHQSMWRELLPFLAYSFTNNKNSDDACKFAHAFDMARDNQAFQSVTAVDDYQTLTKCPAAAMIRQLLNTDLITQKDGTLAIASNPRDGALPGFIYTKLTEQADKAPALRVG